MCKSRVSIKKKGIDYRDLECIDEKASVMGLFLISCRYVALVNKSMLDDSTEDHYSGDYCKSHSILMEFQSIKNRYLWMCNVHAQEDHDQDTL